MDKGDDDFERYFMTMMLMIIPLTLIGGFLFGHLSEVEQLAPRALLSD